MQFSNTFCDLISKTHTIFLQKLHLFNIRISRLNFQKIHREMNYLICDRMFTPTLYRVSRYCFCFLLYAYVCYHYQQTWLCLYTLIYIKIFFKRIFPITFLKYKKLTHYLMTFVNKMLIFQTITLLQCLCCTL